MNDNWLLYDGDCPFCSRYVRLLRLREAVGGLRLVNAREGGAEYRSVLGRGIDLDAGMALSLNGEIYTGADCVHRLALLSTPSGLFNKLNGALFRHPRLSRALYPVLRAGRNLTLRLLGRRKIAAGISG